MTNIFNTEWHSDDYGLFLAQSQRILNCAENGILNAVSVFPNSPELENCMNILVSAPSHIEITVHLNLIEGKSLTPHSITPLLTDDRGVFSVTFGKLLAASFCAQRQEWKSQIKAELRAQIYAVKTYLSDNRLKLDSHAHYHMIPVVFDALMEIIAEDNLNVEYIRIPKEHISLYFQYIFRLKGLEPINLVKVIILNVLAARNLRVHSEELKNVKKSLFMGVFLSGNMLPQNIEILYPAACRLANKRKSSLEILAHPGGVYEQSDVQKITFKNDVEFMTSENRKREAEMFIRMKELV